MNQQILAKSFAITASALMALACGAPAKLPVQAGMGVTPLLPKPQTSFIPLVNVVDAKGWRDSEAPDVREGLQVHAFARGLDHPRWLYVLPNGDVLVAETNAPKRPEDGKGIKGFFFRKFQAKAGGAVPSANRITLLRDTDGDGVAETRYTFLSKLYSPFGMALVGNNFYVANADAVVRFRYTPGATAISSAGSRLVTLPGGKLNHHWTKSLIANRSGTKLYSGVGSNSNAAENGIDKEKDRAAIWEIDVATGAHRVFASGLRNPVGMAWEPTTGALWVAVNERDELGSDLVPDYMTSVRDGGFYGWPYSYYGSNVDKRVKPARPDMVARAIVPDYALGPHTASLGLAYSGSSSLGPQFQSGMFVGQHGSWNRTPRSGYKVIFVPFANGKPAGDAVDILTGFVRPNGDAMGRPVGVAVDRKGALLVADDVGDTIWRVTAR
ncbi:MAG TPA: sorbosone dehydrogenase family protein [Gemmatimonadaceae bacterium]|nr:sorbosone dehydrogenase family protein [Gemmatimonadaceae bacterium]